MATVFKAKDSIIIKASSPHPEGTCYKISIGIENWCEEKLVIKIQMMYDGKISGRKSPSIPLLSDDLKNIQDAITILKNRRNYDV